jgi:hypothetical protein
MNKEQEDVCRRYGAEPMAASADRKLGIAENVRQGVRPLNGLRHPPEGDTTGWYIWGGESLSNDPNFFVPLHVGHLDEWCPEVKKFLALPPGWRFLKNGDIEDVWFDATLLANR